MAFRTLRAACFMGAPWCAFPRYVKYLAYSLPLGGEPRLDPEGVGVSLYNERERLAHSFFGTVDGKLRRVVTFGCQAAGLGRKPLLS